MAHVHTHTIFMMGEAQGLRVVVYICWPVNITTTVENELFCDWWSFAGVA